MNKKILIALILIAAVLYKGRETFFSASKPEIKIVQLQEPLQKFEKSKSVLSLEATGAQRVGSTPYIEKNENSFEPHSVNRIEAEEILDRKSEENPEEEIKSMHHPDRHAGEGRMLLGKFRDGKNETEIFIALAAEDGADHVCLAGPGLFFKKKPGSYTVNVDASGYGIIKFSESEYLRLTWFIEKKRKILGRLFKFENGQYNLIKEFSATEADALVQCD